MSDAKARLAQLGLTEGDVALLIREAKRARKDPIEHVADRLWLDRARAKELVEAVER